eukprot:g77398.t1
MFSVLFGASATLVQAWDYHDKNWGKEFPLCDGSFQTPISVDERDAIYHSGLLGINWNYSTVNACKIDVAKSITLTFTGQQPEGTQDVYIEGGPADHAYRLEQIHMHWSQEDNDMGSEHAFNGKTYALEAHMVHQRADLGSVANAANVAHGLLVVGVLFDVTMDNNAGNKGLDQLIQAFTSGDVSATTRKASFSTPFDFRSLMPADFPRRYYSYQGSLTTPPCFESVTWVLAATRERISMNQLAAFRNLNYMGKEVGNNYRPLQLQRYRRVYKSFEDDMESKVVYDKQPSRYKQAEGPAAGPAPAIATTPAGSQIVLSTPIIAALALSAAACTLFAVTLFFCIFKRSRSTRKLVPLPVAAAQESQPAAPAQLV